MSEIQCPNCKATTHIKSYKLSDGSIEYHCLWCGYKWKENLKDKLKEVGYSDETIKQILVCNT